MALAFRANGGQYVEVLGRVDAVVFDKTGTVTLGNSEVSAGEPRSGATRDPVVKAALWTSRRATPRAEAQE